MKLNDNTREIVFGEGKYSFRLLLDKLYSHYYLFSNSEDFIQGI